MTRDVPIYASARGDRTLDEYVDLEPPEPSRPSRISDVGPVSVAPPPGRDLDRAAAWHFKMLSYAVAVVGGLVLLLGVTHLFEFSMYVSQSAVAEMDASVTAPPGGLPTGTLLRGMAEALVGNVLITVGVRA